MAQTKTRASSKRSSGAKKPQARSRGSSSKSRNSSTGKTRSSQKSTNARGSRKPSPVVAVGNAADKATDAVGNATGKATSAVGHAAAKAKIPLLTGGAALAGAAGGLALGSRQARRSKGMARALPHRPRVKVNSKDLATAAKEVGSFGTQLGQLASELRRTRESANGGRHRSPVEVVLEGLTARRSRA